MGSYLAHGQANAFHSNHSCYSSQTNYLLEQRKEQGKSWYGRGIQLQSPSSTNPCLNDGLVFSPRFGTDSNGGRGVINPLNSSQLMHSKLALSVDNPLCNRPVPEERIRACTKSRVPHSLMSMKRATPNEIEKSSELSSAHCGGICENGQSLSSYCVSPVFSDFISLAEVQGFIYLTAKDQNGCRSLQKIFDEGTCQDVQVIFDEISDHVVELMMNPFGNYLVQKLLDVCSEEQRLQIVLMVTKEPGQLVRISLNTHGTCVVQKLIQTFKTRWQITLVKMTLETGFLDLIKDPNGNHVVQRCLECLSNEDNKFIFDAAAKFCVDIATHLHGCCVMQRCIAHSIGGHQEKLIYEISRHVLHLAQDPFGNYVIQYIIELKIPSTIANLISQFEGNFVNLSMQKFSSHVVEKCLKCFEASRSRIIHELLSVSHFEQLLQDPFANYVIQCALAFTKGSLHATMVEAVQPHASLHSNPYYKRIFSHNLLKK